MDLMAVQNVELVTPAVSVGEPGVNFNLRLVRAHFRGGAGSALCGCTKTSLVCTSQQLHYLLFFWEGPSIYKLPPNFFE